ncbi:MAG: hypothetical protein KC635_26605, partial [Myxococcales bacterium]|nr:hypothetical protein [Myxococcales bacterium]
MNARHLSRLTSALAAATLALATLASAAPARARETAPALVDDLLVDHWSHLEDGLPLDHVTDLARDDAGFIWVATYDGLARFDGERFDVIRRRRPRRGARASCSRRG